jgi:hypothetical protein
MVATSDEDENFILYMILGFVLALFTMAIVTIKAEDSGIPSSAALGIGLFAFAIVLAFWIGTLKVVVSR